MYNVSSLWYNIFFHGITYKKVRKLPAPVQVADELC